MTDSTEDQGQSSSPSELSTWAQSQEAAEWLGPPPRPHTQQGTDGSGDLPQDEGQSEIAPSETARAIVNRVGPPPRPEHGTAEWLAQQPRPHVRQNTSESGDLPQSVIDAVGRLGVSFLSAPTQPMQVARELKLSWRQVRYTGTTAVALSIFWRGDWWDHVGSHYQLTSEDSVEKSLWRVLGDAQYMATVTRQRRDAEGNQVEEVDRVPKPWNPTRTRVRDVLKALESICAVGDDVEVGSTLVFPTETWLETHAANQGTTQRLTALVNAMLNVTTCETSTHDPRYLVTYALPFEYDAEATCPAWDAFLDCLWPGDEESKMLLQEWFGLVLSGDGQFEKMMFIIGPTRSGKGTIARVLAALMGLRNVAGPTLNSFTTQFGLQSLVGKPLAIVGDARSSKNTDIHQVTEKLLMIVAGDQIDIDRKNRDSWTGVLNTRIMMMANQLLNFKDASGAITSRQLLLETKISFLGKEDTTLKDKLTDETELTGILNWAIQGYQRLSSRGEFTEPAAARETRVEMEEKANPLGVFVDEELVFDENLLTSTHHIFKAHLRWSRKGEDTRAAATIFGGDLKIALAARGVELKKVRRTVDGERDYFYVGVGLRNPKPDFAV